MRKMRGLRNGQLVEFTHEDLGERRYGEYWSQFVIDGKRVTSASRTGTVATRKAHDAAALVFHGFDPASLETYDEGRWEKFRMSKGAVEELEDRVKRLEKALLAPTSDQEMHARFAIEAMKALVGRAALIDAAGRWQIDIANDASTVAAQMLKRHLDHFETKVRMAP